MTTTPSDEELENIARAARRKAYKAHGYNCTHDEEFERRDLYEAGLAAGRAAEKATAERLMRDGNRQLVAMSQALESAELKLAALVEGLRKLLDLTGTATNNDAHHHLTCSRAAIKMLLQTASNKP